MKNNEKILELQSIIKNVLAPFITDDYWLLDLPYHTNIGDTLIWQGEIDFLHESGFRCLGMRSYTSLGINQIPKDDLILFHGGGNFGDLWIKPHEYKMRVMAEHPENRFIFFPQTVFFEKEENLKNCAKFMANFNALVCARDNISYRILKENFKNEVLLVPDMAFCINMSQWKNSFKTSNKPLFLKRNDKELKKIEKIDEELSRVDIDIADWPTMCTPLWSYEKWRRKIIKLLSSHPRKLGWLYDEYMYRFYRPAMIKAGVNLLMSHTDIFTTRLHACILSLLLDKENITLYDNSYGKISGFYDTWLTNCESVNIVR